MRNSSPPIEAVYLVVESGNGPAWFSPFLFCFGCFVIIFPFVAVEILSKCRSVYNPHKRNELSPRPLGSEFSRVGVCAWTVENVQLSITQVRGKKKEKKRLFILPSIGCPMFEARDKKNTYRTSHGNIHNQYHNNITAYCIFVWSRERSNRAESLPIHPN